MTEVINVTLCESCLLTDAGVPDLVSDDPAVPLSKLAGYLIGPLPAADGVDSPSHESHFGSHCDGCTTVLSGHRYDYLAVPAPETKRTPPPAPSPYEYEIQGNYGYGYEPVAVEDTLDEARATAKLYRENERKYRFRVRRVRIEEAS